MGFINNYQDNFLPSGNPWGDDNVIVYNMPAKAKSTDLSQSSKGTFTGNTIRESLSVESLGYNDLVDMQKQLNSAINSLPNCPKKILLRDKLMRVDEEVAKRDEMEEISRIERDDNFEIKEKEIKEDVKPIKKPKPSEPPKVSDELAGMDWEDMLYDEDCEVPEYQQAGYGNISNFLIASLVIIGVIMMTKK